MTDPHSGRPPGVALSDAASRDLPEIRLWSPMLWWRYWVRFFASLVPPSPVKTRLYGLTGLKLGPRAFIGESVYFVDGFQGDLIDVGREAVLSPKVTVVAMAMPGDSFLAREFLVTKTAKITVGEGAWIGVGAVLLPGVTIGRGAIVGANAVVTCSIGPLEVWAGVPARFVKRVEDFGRREESV
jgi:acetyltransferase-like isoleucine patch superfamily enzyme